VGKRIRARARGRGGPRYRAPSWRYLGRFTYAKQGVGKVLDIVHDPARAAPVCVVRLDKETFLHIAPEGIRVGDTVSYDGDVRVGNVLPLGQIPVGTKVFGIETSPGSGPKLCRSSGTFALVTAKTAREVRLRLASGKTRSLNPACRATVGVPAGGGLAEKPWVKAGKRWRALKARGKLYPRTRGVAMGPGEHPYGGGKKAPKPRGVSRHAPPGAKVGAIAARRLGKRRGKRKRF
jgi:large subunit ribosomal protein L2